MKKYMLILFSYAGLKKINEYIKTELKVKDQLIVRAMRLEEVPKLFDHLMSDVGFLGEKVVNDVEDSVVDINEDNAEDYLDDLTELAAAEAIELDKKIIEQHNLKNLKEDIRKFDLDRIFINLSHNEFVSNPDKEAEIKKWLEKIKLPKDVFYDGKKQ